MNQPLYGLYSWMKRVFWDDDGHTDQRETLCFVHTDVEFIRTTMNKLWESPELYEGRRNTQMVFPPASFATNEWCSDGGGCVAHGGYTIRELKQESAEAYIASRQAIIDVAQERQEKREAEERERQERLGREAKRKAELQAYYARRQVINEKKRAWYANNKDDINAKRRVYRAEQARIKKEAKAAKKKKWDDLHAEYHEFCLTTEDYELRREAWRNLSRKHKLY